jgi:chromosome segregation ATPase
MTLRSVHRRVMAMTMPLEAERKIRQLDNDVQSIYEMLAEIAATQRRQGNRLAEVDTKLTEVDTKLTEVDTKLTEVDTKLTEVDTKLTEVDTKLTEVNGQLNAMNGRLDTIVGLLGGVPPA